MRRMVRLLKRTTSSSVSVGGGVGGAVMDGERGFWSYDVGQDVVVWENGWLLFFFCSVDETAKKEE